MSLEMLKVMAFWGKEPVPSKICLNNKIIERTNKFTCLGYKISLQEEADLPQKITKCTRTMGIINEVLKPTLVQKCTHICLYKTLAWPVLCYGSEAWTIRKGDSSRLTACELKFMRRTAGYMKWDYKKNEDILMELKTESITEYIKYYQVNWRSRMNRIDAGRFPKAVL